ncbi:chondroitinase [Bacteroides caecigallinarum]|uniref:polysaccharide lyase family 8 super-sandwich domain-containing protein n=1 Tax=Bacteroides caecigallinarum TaxID=1411144 RepID=UPI00195D3E1B|nr:polysaccharide lyase family 8 super-sandwich domain-containing protein [Bacteroides caecigallinarum]MBM6865180.1 chondroitinase [Bacteroides caecigallinarum]
MKLKRNIGILLLFGAVLPNAYANVGVTPETNDVQTITQSIDEAKLKELQEFRKKYKLAEPKASASELKSAQMALKMLMIQRTGDYTATGADLWGEEVKIEHLRDVAKNVRVLSYGALTLGKSGKADLDLYLDYLFTHNFFLRMPKLVYSNYSDVRKIPTDFMSAIPVLDDVRKAKVIAAVQKLLEVDIIRQGDKAIMNWISSDYIFNIVPYVFNLAIANPDDQQAIQDLQLLSGFLRVCTRYNVGNKDILKPDGTGFHHNAHYNGYMYSYRTWVEYFYRFKGTSLKIDKKSYERLKNAIVTIYMTAVCSDSDKNRIYANSMAGRHPFYNIEVPFTQKLFEQLIEIGSDVMGTDDMDLAAYYNYFFKTNKYNVPAKDANGFYQYNYSAAGVYRQPGWVAVMRCPTAMLWTGEIYNKTNRFGRYQGHGTLEVLYEGGLEPTGYPSKYENKGAGWDWNMMPGSTTVHYTDWAEMMPYKNDKDRFDQKAKTTNFAGAVSNKAYGLYAAAFDQGDNWGSQRFVPTNLTFCKSVLAIDGMLFSIGNGISAKGTYADNMITATNLFQTIISKNYNKLVVNGKTLGNGNKMTIPSAEALTVINPVSTGYFVPAGHDEINIVYDKQQTPSSEGLAAKPATEVAAKAYINHGVKPEKKSYSFIVVPAANEAKMKDVADKQTKGELFSIVEMQDSLHVIKYAPKNVLAYSFFTPAKNLSVGEVVSSATELLLIEEKDAEGNLSLAISNPNLRPKMIDNKNWRETPTPAFIELKGTWQAEGNIPGVFLKTMENGNTELSCLLRNGMPVYVNLKKVK